MKKPYDFLGGLILNVFVRDRFFSFLRTHSEMVGRRQGEDAAVATYQQQPFQKPAALIVQKVFIPVVFHDLWNNDDQFAVWVLV